MRKLLLAFLISASLGWAQISPQPRTLVLTANPTGACANGRLVVNITGGTSWICNNSAWVQLAPGTGVFTHNTLSATHLDSTASAAVRGGAIFAVGATPKWEQVAHSGASGGYWKWNGMDVVASTGAAGGTGACTNQVVTAENADAAPTCTTITNAYTSGTFAATAHDTLSATHGDTTAGSAVRGDMITGQVASPNTKWMRLAKGTQYQVLTGGADDLTWGAVALDQSTATSGTLPSSRGGTGNLYTKLAGPTTAEKTWTGPDSDAALFTSVTPPALNAVANPTATKVFNTAAYDTTFQGTGKFNVREKFYSYKNADVAARNQLVGTPWQTRTTPGTNGWSAIAWSPELGLFAVVSWDTGTNQIMTSPDGINWTVRTTPAWNGAAQPGIAWSPKLGLFAAVGRSGAGAGILTSPDGINWTSRALPGAYSFSSVVWSPELSKFVAVGFDEFSMVSSNGIDWTAYPTPVNHDWYAITWSPELAIFVAAGRVAMGVGAFTTSLDGQSWTTPVPINISIPYAVTWAAELNKFVAVGGYTNPAFSWTSPDGVAWTEHTMAVATTIDTPESLAWAPELGLFVSVGDTDAFVQSSPDGITWTLHTTPIMDFYAVAWSPELKVFAAVSYDGLGTDVITWGANNIAGVPGDAQVNNGGIPGARQLTMIGKLATPVLTSVAAAGVGTLAIGNIYTSTLHAGGSGYAATDTFTVDGGTATGAVDTVTSSILSSSLNDGGADYANGDTFTVDTGTTLAVGVVDTSAAGVVLTYHLTSTGSGYTSALAFATTATSGIGTGLKLDLVSGVVLTYHLTDEGDGYTVATAATTATAGSGAGLEIDVATVGRHAWCMSASNNDYGDAYGRTSCSNVVTADVTNLATEGKQTLTYPIPGNVYGNSMLSLYRDDGIGWEEIDYPDNGSITWDDDGSSHEAVVSDYPPTVDSSYSLLTSPSGYSSFDIGADSLSGNVGGINFVVGNDFNTELVMNSGGVSLAGNAGVRLNGHGKGVKILDHTVTSHTAPGIAGANCSLALGNDTNGRITAGAATACVLTFHQAFTAPVCTLGSSALAAVPYFSAGPITTGFTVTVAAASSIDYHCEDVQ